MNDHIKQAIERLERRLAQLERERSEAHGRRNLVRKLDLNIARVKHELKELRRK